MYAQLCLRLNDYSPQSEDVQHAGNFRKLLLHKCQEEFENRRRATAAFTDRDGLSPEEEEQMAVAKRKMLGNIKFVGELYKLGVLHEAIIHSCIKELLERKRGQSVEDISKSMECLCHFMTTVGSKLDTEKAKGWIDQYFARMKDLSYNKELPSRIRFMLMDVIELRECKWVPRRAVAKTGPRPIHLIRHEAYQETQSAAFVSTGGGRGLAGTRPPPLEYTMQGYRSQSAPQYAPPPGASGDEGFTGSPYMRDHLLSPQDHASMTFAPHAVQPLLQTPVVPDVSTVTKTPERKNLRKPPGKADSTVSLRPAMKSMKLGSSAGRTKPAAPVSLPDHTQQDTPQVEGHPPRRGQSTESIQKSVIPRTRDDSSDEEEQQFPSQRPTPGIGMGGHHLLEATPPLIGHAPPMPGYPPYPGNYKMPLLPHQAPPPHHMIPPPALGSLPEQYYSHGGVVSGGVGGGRGLVPTPPHSAGGGPGILPPHHIPPPMMYMSRAPPPGGVAAPPRVSAPPPMGGPPLYVPQVLPQIPSQVPPHSYFGAFPPPPPMSGHPRPPTGAPAAQGLLPTASQGHDYPRPGISAYPPLRYPPLPQSWATPPLERSNPTQPEHEDKPAPRPPNLERNEPVIKYKSGKKSGGGKKTVQDGNEKLVDNVIRGYLKSRDLEKTVNALEEVLEKNVPKGTLCLLLVTRTLEKSEDERTHVSTLLQELVSQEMFTSSQLLQTFTTAINSSQCKESQSKTYLAGFIARAVAKDVLQFKQLASLFDQGAHHPTVLTVLQALTTLLGETEVLKRLQESTIKIASLLPVEYRSHSAISELMESKHLGFLYPLKRIQTELSSKLSQDCSAVSIYKWITANVDSSLYPTTDFVMVLTRSILDHVTSNKESVAKEKECMLKFKILVQKFVSDNVKLQMSVLYATQVFCHDKGFPKGLLLRLFSYLYDMDVIEEESFFKWKEDVPQEYPGKGQALFQVNQWLVLLAESDDEASSDEET